MNQTKYSIWQNARYVIKDFWGWQKRLIIMSIVRIPLIVVLPLLSAFIPKVIIEIMENGGGASQFCHSDHDINHNHFVYSRENCTFMGGRYSYACQISLPDSYQ